MEPSYTHKSLSHQCTSVSSALGEKRAGTYGFQKPIGQPVQKEKLRSEFSKRDSVSKYKIESDKGRHSALISGQQSAYMCPHTGTFTFTHTNKVHTNYKEKEKSNNQLLLVQMRGQIHKCLTCKDIK